jgi:hypothetical protein
MERRSVGTSNVSASRLDALQRVPPQLLVLPERRLEFEARHICWAPPALLFFSFRIASYFSRWQLRRWSSAWEDPLGPPKSTTNRRRQEVRRGPPQRMEEQPAR